MNLNLQKLDSLTVHTTNKEKFSGVESALMAFLMYKRFGRDENLAHNKWCNMLGNSCSLFDFAELVQQGAHIYDVLTGK